MRVGIGFADIDMRPLTLRIQTIQHALDNVQLVLDGEVDEVGVQEDVVGRAELRVVLEEQGRRDLWAVMGGWRCQHRQLVVE